MKTLRVTVQLCLLLCLLPGFAGLASASPLVLTGSSHFPALDGSAQDSDGLADGVLTVAGDLVLDGTIHCNDDPPLPQSSGACPIQILVTGDLTLEAGSAIFAENRRGGGNGGDIRLDVGGDVIVRGTEGSLVGALVSTSRIPGTLGTAGSLTIEAAGAVDLQPGSVLAANSKRGSGGAIAVTGELLAVAGLVASGPSRALLNGEDEVLEGGGVGQGGGTIHLRALGSDEPALRIRPEGIVVSQGEGDGGRLVLFEACGIEVLGLVASLSRNHGPSQVVLRSGKGILIDGRDLGSPAPAAGRFGRIRADGTQQGAAGYLVDLFAEADLQILGPDPSATGLFAVASVPGEWPLRNAGGAILALSLSGTLTATGNAFATGRDVFGDKGGSVDLQAKGDVTLDGATLQALGGFSSPSHAALGGHIDIRSFQGAVSWTFGVGDVRPTGSGVALARRGTIEITACATVDITGTQFPVNGSAVAPFPIETEGVCSPTAPVLPEGEPPLPICAPPNEPPAPSGGPFSIEENSAVGTVVGTVLANDPDPGQAHTFEITVGNTGGAFAIDDAGVITVANSPALDFESEETFELTVEATDNLGAMGSGQVQIHLVDVNEAPEIAEPVNCPALNEGSAVGTNVCLVALTEPDDGQTHTFSITGGNVGGAFSIDSSGQITVASSSALDYETIQTFTLIVEVTDSGLPPALSDTASVTIHLVDVNEAPTPVLDTYTSFGNTQLVAGGLAGTHRAFSTHEDQVDANDTDPDTLNPAFRNLSVVADSGTTSKGGSYSIDTDGRFTYQPPVGYVTTTVNPADPTGPDTFSYSLTDGTNTTSGGTVQITVNHKIWYVHNDPGTAGDAGDSADPVDTLAEAETKSGAGDYIYVFEGDGTNGGMEAGITLKDGQKLLGERVDLVVGGTTLVDADGTKRPEISDGNDTVSVLANTANGNRTGIEIRGLQLSSTGGSAIDLTTADSANLEATIHDVVVTATGGGQEGIDVNAGSTGTVTLGIHGNTLATLGTAIDVQRTAGPVYIKAFDTNAVSGDTTGSGINIAGAIFDAVPGGSFDPVNGGVTVIGAPGNGVGQAGMVLTNVQGGLSFLDLDIFADGGAGLRVSGTGSGMTFGVLPGVGIVEAMGGPAVDIAQASIALPLSSIKSTNSPSTGLALNSVTGSFSAEAGSSISNITSAAGTAFQVGSSNAAITYSGTISTTQGKGVDLTGNTGSMIGLEGALTLSTGTNTAFNATGGGTVIASNTSNTLATTTATALNVANTTIGAGGLHFRSISAGTGAGSSGNGISLDNTGMAAGNGGLVVHGAGAAGSGGTIQHKTGGDGSTTSGIGIYLNNTKAPSLDRMQLHDFDNFAIRGVGVQGFTLTHSLISGVNGNSDAMNEGAVRFDNLLASGLIDNSTIEGGVESNIRVINNTGTLNALVIQNSTIRNNSTTTGGDGIFARAQTGATMTVKVLNSILYGHRDDHIATDAENSGAMTTVIIGNTLTSNGTIGAPPQASTLGGQITVTGGAAFASASTFNISNNAITGAVPAPITINVTSTTSTAAGQLSGTISGNQLGQAGSANSGSSTSDGMSVIVNGASTVNATITNNQIHQFNNIGMQFIKRDGAGNMNLTVTGNTVAEPVSPNALQGILMTSGATSGPPADSGTVCADIGGAGALANTVTGPNFGGDLIRVRQRFATIVRLPGYGGGAADTAAVVTYLTGRNTITNEAPNAKASATTQAPGSFAGGAACTSGEAPL